MSCDQEFRIHWIPTKFTTEPCLGLSHCPGKISSRYGSDLKLQLDLKSIRKQKVKTIITLISRSEIERLQIPSFTELIKENGFLHHQLSIGDMRVPSDSDKMKVNKLIRKISNEILLGCPVLIHCNYGFGRSGLVAALVLKFLNVNEDPVKTVRKYRPGAIETAQQELFVLKW